MGWELQRGTLGSARDQSQAKPWCALKKKWDGVGRASSVPHAVALVLLGQGNCSWRPAHSYELEASLACSIFAMHTDRPPSCALTLLGSVSACPGNQGVRLHHLPHHADPGTPLPCTPTWAHFWLCCRFSVPLLLPRLPAGVCHHCPQSLPAVFLSLGSTDHHRLRTVVHRALAPAHERFGCCCCCFWEPLLYPGHSCGCVHLLASQAFSVASRPHRGLVCSLPGCLNDFPPLLPALLST